MFFVMIAFAILIIVKIISIQWAQGEKWRIYGKQRHTMVEELIAERGTIYADEMEMLSSSIPYFNLHIDFRTPRLREKNGKRFFNNIDSFSIGLAQLFKDKSAQQYETELRNAYKNNEPYFLLKEKVQYDQLNVLSKLPLARDGRNNSGIIEETFSQRLNPFGLMANRTIGLNRDPKLNVGIEKFYDSILKGQVGSRRVQFIAGGVRVPLNNSLIEPVKGNDIVTNLNTHIQDVVQNALHKMMKQNKALYGTAIVMEVATGKIKAIANLGIQKDSSYYEDNNYALMPTEPGSTIKLITLLAGLEDGVVTINDKVVTNGGIWNYAGRTISDVEKNGKTELTYKEAFVHSSNVAMSKLAALHYGKTPNKYLAHFKNLKLNISTGIDLQDPHKPFIQSTNSSKWSAQTLASMGFGYELRISPLQTLMIYNAIANEGKLMKPYLISDILKDGVVYKHIEPTVINSKICSNTTLQQLKECLEEVCISGTARKVFDTTSYKVAGKTGTTYVNDGVYKYTDNVFQSSFVGYFPADNPKYSCIVLIKNKPKAKLENGGEVAAPVFKEIADQLVVYHKGSNNAINVKLPVDSLYRSYITSKSDFSIIAQQLKLPVNYGATEYWQKIGTSANSNWSTTAVATTINTVPNVVGMGLKDALDALEAKKIAVQIKGRGKVVTQSIVAGNPIVNNSTITITLN
jgi:cell division protein FtsI (penicillin-binding protein 3)